MELELFTHAEKRLSYILTEKIEPEEKILASSDTLLINKIRA